VPDTPALIDPPARPEDAMDVLCAGPNVERAFTPAARCDGVQSGDSDPGEMSARASSATLIRPAVDEISDMFDSIACLDDRVRHAGRSAGGPVAPGRYIQIEGPDRTLLIPLGDEVTHIGRGRAADLHLDDSSVSHHHAMLVPWLGGHRILNDRSSEGTFVNGRRIEQSDLHNGDVIALGRVVLRYLEV
jgi:hypothetical protein